MFGSYFLLIESIPIALFMCIILNLDDVDVVDFNYQNHCLQTFPKFHIKSYKPLFPASLFTFVDLYSIWYRRRQNKHLILFKC